MQTDIQFITPPVTFHDCLDIALSNFPLNVFGVPFSLIGMYFDHCKKQIQIFNFFAFLIGYVGHLK